MLLSSHIRKQMHPTNIVTDASDVAVFGAVLQQYIKPLLVPNRILLKEAPTSRNTIQYL